MFNILTVYQIVIKYFLIFFIENFLKLLKESYLCARSEDRVIFRSEFYKLLKQIL